MILKAQMFANPSTILLVLYFISIISTEDNYEGIQTIPWWFMVIPDSSLINNCFITFKSFTATSIIV